MPIENVCPGCGARLRVEDNYAGRMAQCPLCGATYQVPAGGHAATEPADTVAAGSSTAEAAQFPAPEDRGVGTDSAKLAAAPAQAAEAWFLKTGDGRIYGPVSRQQLDAWAAEGRINQQCQVRQQGEVTWQSADQVYPVLQRQAGPGNPFAAGTASATLANTPAAGTSWHEPHRGGVILALGILGLVVGCPLFSFLAWIFGNQDLAKMQAGEMDPSGRDLTQAGRILGLIISIFWIGVIALALLVMLFAVTVA